MATQKITIVTLTEVEVDEFEITDEGLECPVCGELDQIAEVDYARRENPAEISRNDKETVVVPEGNDDRDFHTAGWKCTSCNSDLALPVAGVHVEYP